MLSDRRACALKPLLRADFRDKRKWRRVRKSNRRAFGWRRLRGNLFCVFGFSEIFPFQNGFRIKSNFFATCTWRCSKQSRTTHFRKINRGSTTALIHYGTNRRQLGERTIILQRENGDSLISPNQKFKLHLKPSRKKRKLYYKINTKLPATMSIFQ